MCSGQAKTQLIRMTEGFVEITCIPRLAASSSSRLWSSSLRVTYLRLILSPHFTFPSFSSSFTSSRKFKASAGCSQHSLASTSPSTSYSFPLPPLLSCPQVRLRLGQECGVGGTGLCCPVSPRTADRERPHRAGEGAAHFMAGFKDESTLRQVGICSCSGGTASESCSCGKMM